MEQNEDPPKLASLQWSWNLFWNIYILMDELVKMYFYQRPLIKHQE